VPLDKPLSKQADAMIKLRIARITLDKARDAWATDGALRRLTEAHRTCVLAAKCARLAADVWKHEPAIHGKLIRDAERLERAAAEILPTVATASLRDEDERRSKIKRRK
jgi:hypothetical protein